MENVGEKSLYEEIGGAAAIDRLVERFYDHVAEDPRLSPIFPSDLSETKRKQKQFLTQFTGGGPLYTTEHGHPRLRRRHLPFEITPERAEAWLECMKQAMDESDLPLDASDALFHRLTLTASHMVNQSH
ncbi:LOW QUALITY PROTEIN: hemoglobin-like protein HbO [Geomicrobium sp. JCM 19037]|nr:LOW QUALITY PROTEIN: hemoglobin-like protein HbO [Geomicrobium sp. JCM 19037]